MNETILKFLSLGSLLLLAGCAVFLLLEISKVKNPIKELIRQYQNELIFFFSLVTAASTLSLSLYFQLAPCELCWYQRLFLFAIPFISFIGAVKHDVNARLYAFTLSSIGLAIALYHTLLQAGIFKSVPVFCNPASAADCSVPDFVLFGFVTIPFMSCAVFLTLMVLSYVYKK
jgi:disulfide bond formation protein DsbB